MKGFERANRFFSLCGLNCGLCPMYLDRHCPGCGGGEGNQSCKLARCSLEHGGLEYCFQCGEYPCEKYAHIDDFDSFITHRNRRSDMQKAQEGGLEAYNAEQRRKSEILDLLLSRYNDGRKKALYCAAVNLLELPVLEAVLAQIDAAGQPSGLSWQAQCAYAADLLRNAAEREGGTLKLRRKRRST